ncbi:MAG TPA: DnaJ domain-containing protein [Rubrobacteraceae bacterium]|nr:DnaJ domain-containing protein [Rubrobacteraceae bacterium]
MADQVNYYRVLGVSREASQEEIRSAYRKLAKERHPDRTSGTTEDFSLLQEAHAVLSDPNRRRKHDEALDLAHAADQLAGLNLDFGSLEDELAARREQREAASPSLGERLRGRFGRKESAPRGSSRGSSRTRGRYEVREARWYEPHYFDPEPITWKSGAISFVVAFLAFIAVGQLGLWATGAANAGVFVGVGLLAPFMPILYTLVGLLAAYFAYKAAGYAALALIFVAALVVGGQGGPELLLQFLTVGIVLLLVTIWLGNRRERAARG